MASQTDAERHRAAQAALAEVLARMTGMGKALDNPAVEAALAHPERFYVYYQFIRRERRQPDAETVFKVHFEPTAVLALLRGAGLPLWSADRPQLLAWIAVERDVRRDIASAAAADDLAATLKMRARQRGLHLSLPLMDVQDFAVSGIDVWGRFWEAINAASVRYAPDLVVIGRVQEDADGGWVVDWKLRPFADRDPAWTAEFEHVADSAAAAAGAAVDGIADALAQRFAVRGSTFSTVPATVHGAQTAHGYAALLAHLHSREYLVRVDVHTVGRDALQLRLHSRSSPDQLRELLTMGGLLAVEPQPRRGPLAADPMLQLTWLGEK